MYKTHQKQQKSLGLKGDIIQQRSQCDAGNIAF